MGLIGPIMLACSSSDSSESYESVEPQQQHAVGFTATFAENEGAAGARATRTAEAGDGELTIALLQTTGFGVYCWYTGSTDFNPAFPMPNVHIKDYTTTVLMMNQRVTYSGGQWSYSPSKYWPLNDNEKLTFRAYAPYVSYGLQTDNHGMPMLPVVVKADDYQNGTQHDPLWGTGRLVNPETHEYYPEPDPEAADQSKSKRYGQHYDNMTYEMSGDYRLANPSETRNGYIDWYFHHGMARLIFNCSVIQDPGCTTVTIKGIKVTPLYNQGLLSLSSATARSTEKPTWAPESLDGDMTVDIGAAYLADDPFEITTDPLAATTPVALLSKGLLIIPRDYSSTNMTVTITYSIDSDPEELEATGTISDIIYGNTSYTMRLSLTPSTRGLEITLVQSAFTPWHDAGVGVHTVYNW